MFRLLALALFAATALAVPRGRLQRRFEHNCSPSECSSSASLQNNDICYNWCKSGKCGGGVARNTCFNGCDEFCDLYCIEIAAEGTAKPFCRNPKSIPESEIRPQTPLPDQRDGIQLLPGTGNQPNGVPSYTPVTNPLGALPESEQSGESVALLPLDQSTPLPDDGTSQLADLTNVDLTNADNFGTTQLGLTDIGDLTALAPDTNDYSQFDAASLGGTDPSQLAFADNTIAFTGSDLGTADFNSFVPADGGGSEGLVASNIGGSDYGDFIS